MLWEIKFLVRELVSVGAWDHTIKGLTIQNCFRRVELMMKDHVHPAPIDVTSVLRQGVYVLWYEARCAYVGRSALPIVQLMLHRSNRRPFNPSALGTVRGISYDRVEIYPASGRSAQHLEASLITRLRPLHNTPTLTTSPIFRLKPTPQVPPCP